MSDQLEMFDLAPAQTIYPVDDYGVPDKNDTQTPYCMDCRNWGPDEKIEAEDGKPWRGGRGVCALRKKSVTSPIGYCSRWKKL